jgi:hypothetical protein
LTGSFVFFLLRERGVDFVKEKKREREGEREGGREGRRRER